MDVDVWNAGLDKSGSQSRVEDQKSGAGQQRQRRSVAFVKVCSPGCGAVRRRAATCGAPHCNVEHIR